MRIRVRIYADKEPELYALYKACGPSLTRKIFRRSVCAYIDGTALEVTLPRINQRDTDPETSSNVMFDISIPAEYDEALKKLPARQTLTFVKTLVRHYTFWQMTDAFGVPHKEPSKVQEKIQEKEIKQQPAKVVPIAQSSKTEEPKPVKKAQKEEPVQDLMSLENSDINSLAALFGNIKMN